MWLLSETEIIDACKKGWDEEQMGFPFPSEAIYSDMLAIPMLKAQLKKVVEIIQKDEQFTDQLYGQTDDGEIMEVCFTLDAWQELLKEIGEEE